MAMQLSLADAKKALVEGHRATVKYRSLRAKGEQAAEQISRSTHVMASAFGLGLVQGAGVFKDGKIGPVPLELGAGILFHGLRALGWAGKYGDAMSNFGDGALASYVNMVGHGVGAQHWGHGASTRGSMDGDLADTLNRIAA